MSLVFTVINGFWKSDRETGRIEKSRTNKDMNVTWCEWFSCEFHTHTNRMLRSTAVTVINSIIPTSNTKHMKTNGYVCSLLIAVPVIQWVHALFRALCNSLSTVITAQVRAVSMWISTVSRGYYPSPRFSGFSREVSDWFTVILSLKWPTFYKTYLFTLPAPGLKFNF
jgi:hypothetical protein